MYKSSSNKKKWKASKNYTLKKVFSIFRDFYFDFYMCFSPIIIIESLMWKVVKKKREYKIKNVYVKCNLIFILFYFISYCYYFYWTLLSIELKNFEKHSSIRPNRCFSLRAFLVSCNDRARCFPACFWIDELVFVRETQLKFLHGQLEPFDPP